MATQSKATTGTERIKVTEENFRRAETDMCFGNRVKATGIGKLFHFREVMPIEKQSVIRANRDTLYSTGVFDALRSELANRGVVFAIARPRGLFRVMLERAGVADKIGSENIFKTVHAGATRFEENSQRLMERESVRLEPSTDRSKSRAIELQV